MRWYATVLGSAVGNFFALVEAGVERLEGMGFGLGFVE